MIDEKELDRLAKSTDEKDCKAIMHLVKTTDDEEIFAFLAKDRSEYNSDLRYIISCRSKNPDTLRKMVSFKEELTDVKMNLFDNRCTPRDAILELSKDEDFELSAHIALWTLDEEVLANLANHKNMGIKIEVAETTKNVDTLRKLAYECNNELLGRVIARNTHDTSVFKILLDNKLVNTEKDVLEAIAKNTNDKEILARVAANSVKSAKNTVVTCLKNTFDFNNIFSKRELLNVLHETALRCGNYRSAIDITKKTNNTNVLRALFENSQINQNEKVLLAIFKSTHDKELITELITFYENNFRIKND